jgi:oxygen-independent coproporphyrinogen-3 oxidase
VTRAVAAARRAGFDNLNLALIFGLPEQELSTWQNSLELALGLHPEHLSLYALTLEHGTPLKRWASRGLIPEPDPDLAAEMYEWADGRLAAAGYEQYEISNWSIAQQPCRHNLQYWRGLPYLGLGAGAHGYAAGVRTANVLAPAAYIARLDNSSAHEFPRTLATASLTPVDRQAEIGETMMMGLRLTQEGVSEADFQARFGQSLEALFASEIKELQGYGLLEWVGETPQRRLRLTSRGRLLGNQVFMRFI